MIVRLEGIPMDGGMQPRRGTRPSKEGMGTPITLLPSLLDILRGIIPDTFLLPVRIDFVMLPDLVFNRRISTRT